ncbi:hypothetical protein DAEQUDRAFT_733875 [Daedalea quercina L-15889]|uniref:Uncharacterized protein n=1 Tax=Daedalea quercina L-15889 TaxID=1314783 RepID=A0A165KNW7_9APHY|nr:hypothetical protein DAEQUDRAFT_733875 [Daedalea quercina L-15889]
MCYNNLLVSAALGPYKGLGYGLPRNIRSVLVSFPLSMRFPRLSHLFHRRVKSDGALADVRPDPMATLPSRPRSANGIDELVLASAHPPELSAFFVSDAGVSVSVTHPLPLADASMSAASQPSGSTASELKQRIRELEGALDYQYRANRRIPALERALTDSRTTVESVTAASASATFEASALRARLIQTQRALRTALTSAPSADDRARVLAAENTALASERVRNHRFIELLISAGAHKPVLARAYDDVSAGMDPEEALVAAIREALEKPDSPWTALLEPIIGPRTPDEYRAQVRATLDARKEVKNWRKKAKWWKGRATEVGGVDAITPSPSDISSVVEELSEERQQALNELRERRQGGKVEHAQADAAQASQQQRKESFLPIRHSSLSSHPELATLASALLSSLTDEDLAAAAAPAVRLSPTHFPPPMPASASAEYPRLAPLASQVFRASMSHSSSLHPHSRRSSLSYAPSLSTSFSFPHFKKAAGMKKTDISASSSVSTARSRRRRVAVVAVPAPSTSTPTTPTHLGVTNGPAAPSTVSSLVKLAYIHEETELETTPSFASAPESISPLAREPALSLSRPQTPSRPHSPLSAQHSDDSGILVSPVHQPSSDSEHESDEELVIVMHTDALHTLRNTPVLPSAPFTPSRRQREVKGKGTPSPESKSRLPVLKKAIRRLSISRPVLIDTTNAATFTFTRAKPPAKGGTSTAKTDDTQSKAPTCAAVTASPPGKSRIPGMRAGKKAGMVSKTSGLTMRTRKGTA